MKGLILLVIISVSANAAQIVMDRPSPACQEFRLHQDVKVYKDPSLFLPQLSQIYADPVTGWEELMKESPLVTTLRGTVQIMKLGNEREFKNFGEIAKLYELVDPRFKVTKRGPNEKSPLILPIKICSQDSYNDTMGFVLVSDLSKGQIEVGETTSLPPSGHPNPIPKLRKAPYSE